MMSDMGTGALTEMILWNDFREAWERYNETHDSRDYLAAVRHHMLFDAVFRRNLRHGGRVQ